MADHLLVSLVVLFVALFVALLVWLYKHPLLDSWPFAWIWDEVFASGAFAEQAKRKQCHVFPNTQCVANKCMGWKWVNGGKASWKRLFTKRRGRCVKL